MISDFGKPIQTINIESEHRSQSIYDGVTFTYRFGDGQRIDYLSCITITSPIYRFGNENIGIDSSLSESQRKYSHL